MSGVVCVPANDAARYHFFTFSLTGLIAPVNTQIEGALGSDRIRGRNRLVKSALGRGAEWVLFLDDDHAFGPHLLTRLLSHDEPIVASLYLQRQFPFSPVAYTERDDDGTYTPLLLHDYPPETGLVPIRAAGTGGMLIRAEVFNALVKEGVCEDGVWFKDGEASEDLTFCEKAGEIGFPIYVDLQARLGHCTTSIIWPSVTEDQWTVGAQVAADFVANFPIATREQEAIMDAAEHARSNGGTKASDEAERLGELG